MDTAILPSDLERFAADAVASGRYQDRNEVIAAGLALLRGTEVQRNEFLESLRAAEEESERDGFLTVEEVMQDMDLLIEEMAASRR